MFDKALYSRAPQGRKQTALTVDVPSDVPANITENEDGSVEVDLSGEKKLNDPKSAPHDANLAEFLDDDDLLALGSDLLSDVEDDIASRGDWEKTYKDGLKLLGLTIEERTEPWDGACGIVHPLLAEAVVRFQAELITETFPPHGPVKTKVLGALTDQKDEASVRVRDDMNIEITDRMTEFRDEHERLLWNLPIAGSALKKVYWDSTLGRQVSVFVAAEDFIVSYGATDLASCSRYTHSMKRTANELKKMQVAGFYLDADLSEPTRQTNEISETKDKISGVMASDETEHHTLYEINADLDLPGFEDSLGIALPYVVTVEKDSEKVLSIRRNWEEDDPLRKKQQYFVHYRYIPGFGFYGFGLIHLVGGFAKGATSILRQLVDAGTLSNLPGGLKTRGLRIRGDDTPIAPGEWRDVDIPGGTLKENLLPLPYGEPSVVLAGLLEKIVEEGRKFAAVAEMKVADFDSNSPVGTTMALLERTLKVMSAVQARIYEAMKLEFRLIKDLIAQYGPEEYEYDPEFGDRSMKRDDFALVDVLPVADPNAATMSQRIVQYQAVMQLAASAPQIYDLPELHGQMLDTLGVKNVDKLIPQRKSNMVPTDPVSENMAILTMKPVKAYIDQDHMSHIQVHQAAMQDPKIMAMVGQNPMAPQIQGAAMAHLMEHVAFAYRSQMEQMLGGQLPHPDQPIPPQIEVQISSFMAQAAQKLLAKDQNEAAQQAAQQAAQDPVLQQQQAEVKVKQAEVDRKSAKDKQDGLLRHEELAIERMKAEAEVQSKGVTLGQTAAKHQDQMAMDKAALDSQERQLGFKTAVDLAKQHQASDQELARQGMEHAHQMVSQSSDQMHAASQLDQTHAHEKQVEKMKPKPTKGK